MILGTSGSICKRSPLMKSLTFAASTVLSTARTHGTFAGSFLNCRCYQRSVKHLPSQTVVPNLMIGRKS